MKNNELIKFKKKLRTAIADYISCVGCGCCADVDGLAENKEKLALMLGVKKYSDGSGWDFSRHKSKRGAE